jgi:hypothetical protein
VRFSAPLIPARFLERRKRFLALVELPDGRRVWVHVPNSGALTGCLDPGQDPPKMGLDAHITSPLLDSLTFLVAM